LSVVEIRLSSLGFALLPVDVKPRCANTMETVVCKAERLSQRAYCRFLFLVKTIVFPSCGVVINIFSNAVIFSVVSDNVIME